MQYRSMLSGRRVDAGEVLMGRMITMVAALMVLAGCRGDDGEVGDTNEDDDRDGYTEAEGDCDDGDPLVHPGAEERCNAFDDDCDGWPDVVAVPDGVGWGLYDVTRACSERETEVCVCGEWLDCSGSHTELDWPIQNCD